MLILISATVFFSCKSKSPIWDREPVDKSFSTGFPLDEFHRLGEANDTVTQKALVNQHRKQLTKNVMAHYTCVTDEKNVKFVFGSGSVKGVLSGDGKNYDGKFKNELIVIIHALKTLSSSPAEMECCHQFTGTDNQTGERPKNAASLLRKAKASPTFYQN